MTTAAGIDWPGIQAAAAVIGIRPAARQAAAHLPEIEQNRFVERVMKRASRQGWLDKVLAVKEQHKELVLAGDGQAKAMSANVRNGAEITADILADDSRETRLSLSRSARQLARQAESAELPQAGDVLQAAKVASLVHGWDRQDKGVAVQVNVAVLRDPAAF